MSATAISAEQHLGGYGVTMRQAYEFIMGNIGDLENIYKVCKQFGVTTDMIGEVLTSGGLAVDGLIVANYFAANGVDSSELGGTLPTVEVKAALPDHLIISKDEAGRTLAEKFDQDQNGTFELRLQYEYDSEGRLLAREVFKDKNNDGVEDHTFITEYGSNGVVSLEELLEDKNFDGKTDVHMNFYYTADGKRSSFDMLQDRNLDGTFDLHVITTSVDDKQRPLAQEVDEGNDGIFEVSQFFVYNEDNSFTRYKDTNSDGLTDVRAYHDINGQKYKAYNDGNKDGVFEALETYDENQNKITVEIDTNGDNSYDILKNFSYNEKGERTALTESKDEDYDGSFEIVLNYVANSDGDLILQ